MTEVWEVESLTLYCVDKIVKIAENHNNKGLMMKKNIGTADRVLRFIIGLILLAFGIWQNSWLAIACALFTFYEAFASWCIFYQFIGKDTCPVKLGAEPEDSLRKIDARRLGFAGGILWGLTMFLMTILSLYTGYASHFLTAIGDLYPGYAISWTGSFIGLVYGFLDALIGLFLLGWIYNKLPN
jgi:hypothetical protein